MKKNLVATAASLVAAMVVLVAPGIALADPPDMQNDYSNVVQANYSYYDATGCIQTTVGVSADEGVLKGANEPAVQDARASLTLSVVDTCNSMNILSDAAFVLDDFSIVTANGVTSATLDYTGTTVGGRTIDVHLTWTALGTPRNETRHINSGEFGCRFVVHANFMTAWPYEVNGSFVVDGVDYIAGQEPFDAYVILDQTGVLVKCRQ